MTLDCHFNVSFSNLIKQLITLKYNSTLTPQISLFSFFNRNKNLLCHIFTEMLQEHYNSSPKAKV